MGSQKTSTFVNFSKEALVRVLCLDTVRKERDKAAMAAKATGTGYSLFSLCPSHNGEDGMISKNQESSTFVKPARSYDNVKGPASRSNADSGKGSFDARDERWGDNRATDCGRIEGGIVWK